MPRPYGFRPVTADDAQAIAGWRYPAPHDVYDGVPLGEGYFAVLQEDELVGFCCFGAQARVPGVEEEPGVVDVGWGLRPDLVGQGHGRAFCASVVERAREEPRAETLRVAILAWNERSQGVARAAGFQEGRRAGRFVVMTRLA